jgi:hypothetical protein
VPVELSEPTATGFLREFNFHTLTQGVLDRLFGEVERPKWMKFTLGTEPDPLAQQFVFTIDVTLEKHDRDVDLGPTPRSSKTVRVVGLRRARRIAFRFPVPQTVIRELRSEVPNMYSNWLEGGLKGSAHKFYELDPRIGWRHLGVEPFKRLPHSPLLDPREPFSRTGLPFPAVNSEGWDPILASLRPPRCSFCRGDHAWSEPPVWAGANLMWVHARCWGPS